MGRILKALGLQMRAPVEMGIAGCGLEDRDGQPVMSRVDPETGLSLGFDKRGFDGRGTPDEARAKALRKKR